MQHLYFSPKVNIPASAIIHGKKFNSIMVWILKSAAFSVLETEA